MPDANARRRSLASPVDSLPAVAAAAMACWVAVEFAVRRGLGSLLAAPLGSGLGADAAAAIVGAVLAAGLVAWLGGRAGLRRDDWAYALELRPVLAGFGGFLAYWVVYLVAAAAIVSLLGGGGQPPGGAAGSSPPAWAVGLFLLGNGIVVPVTEELAWRGVVQTALTEAYGTWLAVVATAVAFVGKHLVVDLGAGPLRLASLVVLAFVLGALRARWGTTSSTVAHLATNLVATATLLAG